MLRIEIITLFPEIFSGFLASSLIKKAVDNSLLEIRLAYLRDFADPPHFKVDDELYGGGAGMLFKPEPLAAAIESAKKRLPGAAVILLAPAGELFKQQAAEELSRLSELIIICGRYEGIDQRVSDLFVDKTYSIGDYVLMGGEIPAMVLVEAVARLNEQVIGNSDSITEESFSDDGSSRRLLEAPHYTRPPEFRGLKVPDVLLSGNHKEIEKWRKEQSLAITKKHRPDLV